MNLPLGYQYAATYAGIRKQPKDDLALIVSGSPANAAAVFTTNMVQAAPVRTCREHLRSSRGKVTAVLINAGNANCATRTGERVALASCESVAKALKTKRQQVLPASTGVIGVELDQKLITKAIPGLVAKLSPDEFNAVAQAILTTDTRAKVAYATLPLKQGSVRIAGMTKGSGMINPHMATTLAFVMTDAVLSAGELRQILLPAVDQSFNALTVDGDMSTNDTLILLANGAAKVRPNRKERGSVAEAVTSVLNSLAKQIAADGEGARKLITVRAAGFKTREEATKIARAIANSPLVKTAIAGSDPNWGRILAAAGYAGVNFNPSQVDVYLQEALVCRRGLAAEMNEAELKTKLDQQEVEIRIVLNGGGKGEARFFTCDLTEGYIRINGSYRS